MAENIGELYLQVKADISSLKTDMESLKSYLRKTSDDSKKLLHFKTRFDNSLAKLGTSELQSLHKRLRAELERKIKLDFDSRSIELTKAKLEAVESRLNSTKQAASGFASGLGAIFAKVGGLALLTKTIVDAVKKAQQQIIVEQQVAQAIKTTGQAAGYTANELFKMASQLQRITGISDEIILQDVTNQLLTFTNISGEVFKKAQQSVLDLNAVISKGDVGSLSSQAIQLGKALENPIRGIQSLTRVGVTFTEQQRKQVELLVKQGDLQSAQAIILDEISNKYGGQAKALNEATGGLKNFSSAIGDFLEKIGTPLLVLLQKIGSALNSLIAPIDNVTEGYIEQKKSFDELQKTVNPLLKRYDELKSKSNLNKIEQGELKSVIEKLALSIPTAIKAFDEYGRATDINRGKIEEFIKTEQKRLAIVNKNDIEEFNKKKALAEKKKKLIQEELEKNLKAGKKTITTTTAQGVIQSEVKLTGKDIKEAQNKIKQLQDEIDGYNAQLSLLTGKIDEIGSKEIKAKAPPVLTYADEVLDAYREQQLKLDDINKKLKEGNLSEEEKNILLLEQKKLQEAINQSVAKQKTISGQKTVAGLGYTAEQIVEFEKLKFAIEGYVNYRRELIELEYKNEVERAKDNAELIKQAELNKNIALIKLKEEETEFKQKMNEKQIEDYEKLMNEIDNANREAQRNVLAQEVKYNEEKKKALEKYYNDVKAIDDEYWQWKIEQIRVQAEEFYLATGDSVKAKQLEIEQLKQLEQDYFAWRIEQLKTQYGLASALFTTHLDSLEAGYDTFWNIVGRTDMTGAEKRQAIWEQMKQTALQTIGDIIKGYISNLFAMMVVGDTFKTAELGKGVALGSALYSAYAPAALAASIMSFGGASVAGLVGYQSAMASLMAQKAISAVPKFASGGDFIVPQGFPNDSFPILVQSGERVQVTPSGKVGVEIEWLQKINNSIQALTQTLYKKPTQPIIKANIDSLKFTIDETIPNLNKVTKIGLKAQ